MRECECAYAGPESSSSEIMRDDWMCESVDVAAGFKRALEFRGVFESSSPA